VLAPSNASGTGGAIAEAAATYNSLATTVATSVNSIMQTGSNSAGTTGLSFFTVDPAKPAALGLSVIPTDATGIAASTPGSGGANGDVANSIANLSSSATGADSQWETFVVHIGSVSAAASSQATLTATGLANASSTQSS